MSSVDQNWLKILIYIVKYSEKLESKFGCNNFRHIGYSDLVEMFEFFPGRLKTTQRKRARLATIPHVTSWPSRSQRKCLGLDDSNFHCLSMSRNQAFFYEPSLLRSPLSFPLNIGTISILFCQLTRFFKYTWNLETLFKILQFDFFRALIFFSLLLL